MNKESIVKLLKTNDKAVARALVVLNERQTADEQQQQDTKYQNGRGFRPCHARMGTSMAQFYEKRGYLTAKQVAYWRQPDRAGNMRIGIYAGQLLEVAKAKKAAEQATGSYAAQAAAQNGMVRKDGEFERAPKQDPLEKATAAGRDPGNDAEALLVLTEQIDNYKLEARRERNPDIRDEILREVGKLTLAYNEIKKHYI